MTSGCPTGVVRNVPIIQLYSLKPPTSQGGLSAYWVHKVTDPETDNNTIDHLKEGNFGGNLIWRMTKKFIKT